MGFQKPTVIILMLQVAHVTRSKAGCLCVMWSISVERTLFVKPPYDLVIGQSVHKCVASVHGAH